MLFERVSLTSTIEADKVGLSVLADACETLITRGPQSIDELWAGEIVGLLR